MTTVVEVPTPGGTARLHVEPATAPEGERCRLLLGHGAGGGVEAPDLAALAAGLPGRGVTVLRLEQPWRVAGRRLAGRPATLDEALQAVLAHLDRSTGVGGGRTPLVLGGRSAGARSACRVAAARGPAPVAGVVCLAFPLHPPGRPERSRREELVDAASAGVPLLVVQGTRDALGSAADVTDALGAGPGDPGGGAAGATVVPVELADHAFAVPVRAGAAAGTSTAASLAHVVAVVADALDGWLRRTPVDPGVGGVPE